MSILKKFEIFRIGLTVRDRFLIIFCGIIAGIMEILTSALIMNFTAIFENNTEPKLLGFNFLSWYQLVIVFCFLLLIKLSVNLTGLKIQTTLIFKSLKMISTKLLGSYLNGPIEDVFGEGHSVALRNIFNECNIIAFCVFLPASVIISELIIAFILFIYLINVNIFLSLPVIISPIAAILILWLPVRKILPIIGRKRQDSEAKRLEIISDTLRIIPDLTTQNLQGNYLNSYSKRTDVSTSAMADFNVIKSLPRFSGEIIMFGSILISFLLLSYWGLESKISLSELSGALFVLYRLFPCITRISANLNTIKFNWVAAEEVKKRFKITRKINQKSRIQFDIEQIKKISWGAILDVKKPYYLDNLVFSKGINLVKGKSGSGKTSLLLALAGLNNNVKISYNNDYQNNHSEKDLSLSYTSQGTILTGNTVMDAITAQRNIDHEKINIFVEFISNCFYKINLNTPVKTLSGGQIKVIALLRSLYQDKKYYLLDEIFSGVDKNTTEKCLNFMRKYFKDKIFLIVDHNTIELNQVDNLIKI